MFANRFTAFIDACSLASVLRRNLLLSLAEAEFFRVRWSVTVLSETERAIAKMAADKGLDDPEGRAARARASMELAFAEASVEGFDHFMGACPALPDKNDMHVVAAALKTRADVIVTENLADFPPQQLEPLGLDVRTADEFIADTIALDPGKAVAAIRQMRLRLKRPEKTPEVLLIDMEAAELMQSVDVLKLHVQSL
ncbi:hypothetical protein ADZ37_16065 [Pannonibacter phragmitetus]|uniref:PIN domain-containing protein n=1 Tax=Pannonibacter phragmitetus TaxID=121719 RepID=UPI00067C0500|nr:PIN domain-containing protein [Pannonibacter phragmitetus]KND17957.1 hypothetical protein ADZ37_16065 [Pannonibacter phragmitetus]